MSLWCEDKNGEKWVLARQDSQCGSRLENHAMDYFLFLFFKKGDDNMNKSQ